MKKAIKKAIVKKAIKRAIVKKAMQRRIAKKILTVTPTRQANRPGLLN